MTSPRPTLDDVLQELQSSVTVPDESTTKAWCDRYPNHAEDIALFINEWLYQIRSTAKPAKFNKDLARTRASSDLTSRLDKFRSKVKPAGILATAKTSNIDIAVVASKLRCNIRLLEMLDNKEVQFSTIPDCFIDALANGTNEPVDWIVGSIAATHRGRATPTLVRGVLAPESDKSFKTFAAAWIESGLSQKDLESWMK